MTTRAEERVITETPVPDRPLWHNAKTWADYAASLRGQPWTALCGKRCQNQGGIVRHWVDIPPMDSCQVCRDLVAGGALG